MAKAAEDMEGLESAKVEEMGEEMMSEMMKKFEEMGEKVRVYEHLVCLQRKYSPTPLAVLRVISRTSSTA